MSDAEPIASDPSSSPDAAARPELVAPSVDAASSSTEAATTNSGGSRKRRAESEAAADEIETRARARKLTKKEEQHLKFLASLPSMRAPLRDERGRRRATCVTQTEIVEAGLSALVDNSSLAAAPAAAADVADEEAAVAAS